MIKTSIDSGSSSNRSYPKLMIHPVRKLIILATGRDGDYFKGMIINKGTGVYNAGYKADTFSNEFIDFEGKITLENGDS